MAVDMFMNIEGIPGESKDKIYKDAIVVQAWNWGVSNSAPVTSGSRGAGKPVIQVLTFTKPVDKATPMLYLNTLQGRRIKTCILTCRNEGAKDKFLEIKMSDCNLDSVLTGCKVGEDKVTETVGIQFTKVEIEYTAMDASGKPLTVKSTWDINRNAPV